MKRMVIADAQLALAELLADHLEHGGQFQVVARACTGIDALEACRRHAPDLLVLDLMLPELCGIEVMRRLRAEVRTRILVFSGSCDQETMMRALRCRPHAFVEKKDTLSTLTEAIAAVIRGANYYTGSAAALLYEAGTMSRDAQWLSDRETEVLQMIAEGLSSKEIANRLTLAVKTVENHRGNLMRKLSVHNTAGLTRYAIRSGLLAIS